MELTYDQIARDAARAGLDLRGAFHPYPGEFGGAGEDQFDAAGADAGATLVLLGFAGGDRFAGFARSREFADGAPHPLDRWSRRLVEGLAADWGGVALFPFGGPPWHPFQRWAMRAEPVHPSPIGLLIHPEYGLWHSYRGAVLLKRRLSLPPRAGDGERETEGEGVGTRSPCEACPARPCLAACPVGAYTVEGFDPAPCAAHLASPAGAPCMEDGCLARRACPVGARHRHGPTQAAFTMAAFLRAR
jgi:hypothetical protein